MDKAKEIERFIAEYGENPALSLTYHDSEQWENKLEGALWRAKLDRTEELEKKIKRLENEIDDLKEEVMTAVELYDPETGART